MNDILKHIYPLLLNNYWQKLPIIPHC